MPRKIFIPLFLALATFAVYWQVHQFDFVTFDDADYVLRNHHVQDGITSTTIQWAFAIVKQNERAYWHPITWLSHMADCSFFGLQSGKHHLSNLFFHILNTLLLFFVLNRMTGAVWKSAFVAAVFALHPINVESVAWISERKNLLSTLFWMLTILAYTHYAAKPSFSRYLLVFISLVLGLMSKPVIVTLPFVLLLLDYWPLYRLDWGQRFEGRDENAPLVSRPAFSVAPVYRLILEKIPLLIVSLAAPWLAYTSLLSYNSVLDVRLIPVSFRIENALVSYIHYIGKLVWPVHLAIFYPFPKTISTGAVIASVLILIGVSIMLMINARKRPYLLIGWLWYLGTLVPMIGLVQNGLWPELADRWVYVPFIGLFIMMAWGVPEPAANRRHGKTWLAASAAVVLLLLAALTWKQTGYWKNSFTLFDHALEVTADNYVSHYNLGVAWLGKGDPDKAISEFYKSLNIYPQGFYTHVSLGAALEEKGEHDRAIRHFQAAASLNPESDYVQYNLGTAYLKTGDLDQAIVHLQKAALLDTNNAQAYYNLGDAFFKKKDEENAESNLRKTLELAPDHANAMQLLGVILFKKGKLAEAGKYFDQVLKQEPSSPEVHNFLGAICLQQRNIPDAVDHFKTALKYDPDNGEARKNLEQLETKLKEAEDSVLKNLAMDPNNVQSYYQLGDIYHSLGLYDKSIEQYKKSLVLQPQSPQALYGLSVLYSKKGEYDAAISYLEQIISKQPDNPKLYYNLACMYAKAGKTEAAIEYLSKAVKMGYANWEQIRTDNDLDAIRDTDYFKQLLEIHPTSQ